MAVTNRDGDDVSVPGGNLLQVHAAAGWRFVLGGGAGPGITIIPGIGGFYERHAAHDLENERVFPSHTRTGAEVRVAAHVPIGPANLLLEGGVSPFSTWTEDPEGAMGKDPAPALAPSFRAGVDLPAGSRGRIAVDLGAESRSVQYSDVGSSGLALTDAKRDELLTTLGVSFRYRF
jgi:hypothetical protein